MAELSIIATPLVMVGINEVVAVVKKFLNFLGDKCDKLVYRRANIKIQGNPRCRRAFIEEIKSQDLHKKGSDLQIGDGFGNLNFDVQEKTYTIKNVTYGQSNIKAGRIKIVIEEDKIIVKSRKFFNKLDEEMFKNYLNETYSKYNAPSKVMMFFTSEDDKWAAPICRTPRNFKIFKLTEEMEAMVDDVDNFMKAKQKYMQDGIPFKRGYLLYGGSGTGKSTCIEMVANKYNMSVYLITLNGNDNTDTTLINLLSRVPSNSVIAIEEIDKQLAALQNNPTTNVSLHGILSAIDGPQRLSDSTIVIMTSNSDQFLTPDQMGYLCRPGRIDRVIKFQNKV